MTPSAPESRRSPADDGGEASAGPRRLTAELYVRANSPAPVQVQSVIETLGRLSTEGGLADYTVHAVPSEIEIDGWSRADADEHLRTLFDVADRLFDRDEGHRYPFRRVARQSLITDETADVLLLPVLCLLVYDGSELIDVAPHHGPDTTWSGEDSLELVAETARWERTDAPVPTHYPIRTPGRTDDPTGLTGRLDGGGE